MPLHADWISDKRGPDLDAGGVAVAERRHKCSPVAGGRGLPAGGNRAARAGGTTPTARHSDYELLTLPCPSCDVPLRVPPVLAGSQIRCLSCRTVLEVETAAANSQAASETIRLAPAGTRMPCPNCGDSLRLVPQLDGRQIRCQGCRAVLGVSASPWRLDVVEQPSEEPAAAAEPKRGRIKRRKAKPQRVEDSAPAARNNTAAAVSPAAEPDTQKDEVPSSGIGEAEILEALGISVDGVTNTELDHWETVPVESIEPVATDMATADEAEADETTTAEPAPQRELLKIDKGANQHARVLTSRQAVSPIVLKVFGGVAGIVALAAGIWGLAVVLGFGPVHSEARYLPSQCAWYLSMDWQKLDNAAVAVGSDGLPGLELVNRCRIFLEHAGIGSSSVERINVGRPPGETGLMLVFRLTKPVDHESLMALKPFSQYKRKDIRGIPVYTLGTSALAFPEANLIVNGQTSLLCRTMQSFRRGFRRSPCELLETADFSAMNVAVSDGIPSRMVDAYLQDCDFLSGSVVGTVDSFRYGKTISCRRTIYAGDGTRAVRIQQSLSNSLREAAADSETAEQTRQLLAAVEVSQSGPEVHLNLDLDSDQLSSEIADILKRLF